MYLIQQSCVNIWIYLNNTTDLQEEIIFMISF